MACRELMQDALVHCVLDDAGTSTHASRSQVKHFMRAKCGDAFGEYVSSAMLSRLQNARHQIFVRETVFRAIAPHVFVRRRSRQLSA